MYIIPRNVHYLKKNCVEFRISKFTKRITRSSRVIVSNLFDQIKRCVKNQYHLQPPQLTIVIAIGLNTLYNILLSK